MWTCHVKKKSTGVIICNYINASDSNQCFMILQFAAVGVFMTFSLLNVIWAIYLSFIKKFRTDPNPEQFLENWQYLSTMLPCRIFLENHCRISTMYRIYSKSSPSPSSINLHMVGVQVEHCCASAALTAQITVISLLKCM